MLKKQIELKNSPFEKQRDMKAPRGSENLQTQVSQDMLEDFMKYARQYNVEYHVPRTQKGNINRANPLKHIINEFLNSHALERKCFTNLHVIMVLNNPFEYDQRKAAVIGFVNHPEKFTKFYPFNLTIQRRYKTGLLYVVEEFEKSTYDLLNLESFNHEVLFNIHPSLYGDFEKVKQALQYSYENIDFNNVFFVMFNLNNYLDILQNGVYVSETSKDKHEGFIVLLEPCYKVERLCLRVMWSFHDNKLDIEFSVEDVGFVNCEMLFYLPVDCFHEYWSITSGLLNMDISKLEMDLKQSKERIESHKKSIEFEQERSAHIIKKLDKIKKQ